MSEPNGLLDEQSRCTVIAGGIAVHRFATVEDGAPCRCGATTYHPDPYEGDCSGPVLIKITTGWLAKGERWAVDGATQDDALAGYREAERRHRAIDARPYLYERLRADAARAEQPTAEGA